MGGASGTHERNAYRTSVGKPCKRVPTGRPGHRYEDNIKIKKKIYEFDSICLAQNRFYASEPPDYIIRGLLEKYPTFGREKETGLLGALDT